MKNKRYLPILALLTTLFLIGGCGSSSSSDSTEETSVGADESAGATVSAVFSGTGGESSVNEASLSEKILEKILMIKTAIAQESFTACDAVQEASEDGITMSTDGENGTYGNSSEPIFVNGTDAAFCNDGGLVAAWNISTALEMPCTDASNNSFTASMLGNGVFVQGSSMTDIFGSFTVTVGSDSATLDCTFHMSMESGEVEFSDESCELDGGTLVSQNDGISCEGPDSDSGEVQDSAISCSDSSECANFISGMTCDSSNICVYGCSTDADCLPLNDIFGHSFVCEAASGTLCTTES